MSKLWNKSFVIIIVIMCIALCIVDSIRNDTMRWHWVVLIVFTISFAALPYTTVNDNGERQKQAIVYNKRFSELILFAHANLLFLTLVLFDKLVEPVGLIYSSIIILGLTIIVNTVLSQRRIHTVTKKHTE